MLWQGGKCFDQLMVVVVINNFNCLGHSSFPCRRNLKFAARFHCTGIPLAFLLWDVFILGIAVFATFGTSPCSFCSYRTVDTDGVSMCESVVLQDSLNSIKILTVVVANRRWWPKWTMFCK